MGALEAGITAGSGILGAGLGMLTRDWSDRKQLEQQEKLQKLGIEGSKEMGEFNQNLALETWEKTNFEAQRKQMEKAGLNVGMMYSGSGGGGTVSNTAPGNVSGGNAPAGGGEIGMGMQLGTATAMNAAQIENIKASTENIKADTAKKTGVDTTKGWAEVESIGAATANMKQMTKNAEVQESILKYEKEMAKYDAMIKSETYIPEISKVWTELQGLEAELKSKQAKGNIDQATASEMIKQARVATTGMVLHNELTKAQKEQTVQGTEKIRAEIGKIAADIENLTIQQSLGATAQDIQNQQLEINKKLQEWETSGFKQGVEIGRDLMKKLGESNPAGGMRKK